MNNKKTYKILNSEEIEELSNVYKFLKDKINDSNVEEKIGDILKISAKPITLNQLVNGSNPSILIDDAGIFSYLNQMKKQNELDFVYLASIDALKEGLRKIYSETEIKYAHDPFQPQIMRKKDYEEIYGIKNEQKKGAYGNNNIINTFDKLPGCP